VTEETHLAANTLGGPVGRFTNMTEQSDNRRFDVAIIGGGIAGLSTAARLQARGVRTVVLEAHSTVGGCAGYFRHRGFSFDVGATTFVDFAPGGAGAEFCEEIGMSLDGEVLPGYVAWLPDRTVTLHRDQIPWHAERIRAFGSETTAFWELLDHVADVFWRVSRTNVRMPMRTPRDLFTAARAMRPTEWPLARYLTWTMEDALRHTGIERHQSLRALLGMLVQDTVHSTVEDAPFINAALGVTIRGAGLTRPTGGARGFFQGLVAAYERLGGEVRTRTIVDSVTRNGGEFDLHFAGSTISADRIVSTLPAHNTARLGLGEVRNVLEPHLDPARRRLGGALVLHLGVPDREVANQQFSHHQILDTYDTAGQDWSNIFISVSAQGDVLSAPLGHRAVMISTHCELEPWQCTGDDYTALKQKATDHLLRLARRVYPTLRTSGGFMQLGTPQTYARFTRRWLGAVGGFKQTKQNSNQRSLPSNLGVPGFHMAGDSTWPGLGTVAAILASRNLALDMAGPPSWHRSPVALPTQACAIDERPRGGIAS
jgi:C-3',4' desaturase CrtD